MPCALNEACVMGVCERLVWTGLRRFTNCSTTGRTGPTQSACDTAYGSTTLAGEVTVTGGIQEWTVPTTGTYRIEVFGAQGASGDPSYTGGLGARVRGDFTLSAGTVLHIVVGQQGTQDSSCGSGGGGSFVADDTGTALIVGGGGAGTRTSVSQNGCAGRISQEGGTGSGSGMTHTCVAKTGSVTMGGIVSSTSWGSGGGGFSGDGANDSSYGTGGQSYSHGANGGEATSCCSAPGGFGGGGAGNGCYGGGGGGGYSGGDGGRVAGGGGSYNSGSSPDAAAGFNSGHGYVTIDLAP